jgi:hypothetical protein
MWMERRLAGMKSSIPNWLATAMAGEWAGALGDNITDLGRGIAEIEAVNLAKHYERWHVPWLGHMENPRPDKVFRILGGQLNSASSLEVRTLQVADVVCLINDWEIQAGCLLEVGVNWFSYPSLVNLASWFCDEIQDIRTHTAHNKHENVAYHQPGETATFACKELVRYTKECMSNHRGLGRWCLTLFYANPNYKFRLVSAYNVGRQRPRGDSTIYQQQVQYIQHHNLDLLPACLFVVNFIAQLQTWQKQGNHLLIFINMNEHILKGHLAWYMLKMGLAEATHQVWETKEPRMYFGGMEPIDRVWHSHNLDITLTLQLSFHEGVRDHQSVIVDITTALAIGKQSSELFIQMHTA